jgi:uncharacterized protein YndB with AHSA1/START domain
MEPKFQVQLKILKPVAEVFEAVVNPKKLTGYFTKTASGPLTEGMTVHWSFVEDPTDTPVKVRQVIKNDRIVLEWPSAEGGYDTRVEMVFKPLDGQATMVQISESGWRDTPKGIESSYGNCSGWMHMACCLKAYLEHGINLRAGGAL